MESFPKGRKIYLAGGSGVDMTEKQDGRNMNRNFHSQH